MAMMEIRIKSDTRPCVLTDGTRALFHGLAGGHAVIEYETGMMDLRIPETIRLLDSQDRFSEYFLGDDE